MFIVAAANSLGLRLHFTHFSQFLLSFPPLFDCFILFGVLGRVLELAAMNDSLANAGSIWRVRYLAQG